MGHRLERSWCSGKIGGCCITGYIQVATGINCYPVWLINVVSPEVRCINKSRGVLVYLDDVCVSAQAV